MAPHGPDATSRHPNVGTSHAQPSQTSFWLPTHRWSRRPRHCAAYRARAARDRRLYRPGQLGLQYGRGLAVWLRAAVGRHAVHDYAHCAAAQRGTLGYRHGRLSCRGHDPLSPPHRGTRGARQRLSRDHRHRHGRSPGRRDCPSNALWAARARGLRHRGGSIDGDAHDELLQASRTLDHRLRRRGRTLVFGRACTSQGRLAASRRKLDHAQYAHWLCRDYRECPGCGRYAPQPFSALRGHPIHALRRPRRASYRRTPALRALRHSLFDGRGLGNQLGNGHPGRNDLLCARHCRRRPRRRSGHALPHSGPGKRDHLCRGATVCGPLEQRDSGHGGGNHHCGHVRRGIRHPRPTLIDWRGTLLCRRSGGVPGRSKSL